MKERIKIMSKKLSQEFEYDDFDDAVDLVLSCDSDIDAAIERAAERADETGEDDLVTCMKENGDVPFDDDIEGMMYDEDEDDAVDIADVDAQDYREAYDLDEAMEDAEDQVIDTVIDADPQAEIPYEDDELDNV